MRGITHMVFFWLSIKIASPIGELLKKSTVFYAEILSAA